MVRLRGIGCIGLLAAALFAAGCGESDSTPATVTTSTASPGTPTAAAGGDATAGRTVFETRCELCHRMGGTEAGAGPVLSGLGLDDTAIKKQIREPRNAMPPNIVTGKDLEDVTAFVLTLQQR